MQRTNTSILKSAAAALFIAAGGAIGLQGAPAPTLDARATARKWGEAASIASGRVRFGTRASHYHRPGDSVRQHARKAARRANQARARRAARG